MKSRLTIDDVTLPDGPIQHFWSLFRKDESSGCWLWTRALTGGRVRYGTWRMPRGIDGRMIMTHRLAWILTNGSIPEGKEVLHTCDVGRCGNPAHLFLGTQLENVADMIAKGRHNPGRPFGELNGTHTHPESVRRGDAVKVSKLSEDDVRWIRRKWKGGMTQAALARHFSVAPNTIFMVVKHLTWSHVL